MSLSATFPGVLRIFDISSDYQWLSNANQWTVQWSYSDCYYRVDEIMMKWWSCIRWKFCWCWPSSSFLTETVVANSLLIGLVLGIILVMMTLSMSQLQPSTWRAPAFRIWTRTAISTKQDTDSLLSRKASRWYSLVNVIKSQRF